MAADGDTAFTTALVEEATRKAGLVWLSYGAPAGVNAARPAWHAWVDGAAYVVVGGTEQQLPGLVDATSATVIVPSKDNRGRVVAWEAALDTVVPGSRHWAAATAALAGGRLNAEGGAAMVARWERECSVVRLVPTGPVAERADAPSTDSLAAQPRATTATTLGRQPKMVGGVRRRRR